jgi:LysR family glycine cleavage system transcriptional activator
MKRNLPPLTALRSFEAAARHLSFTKAAEELFVTQAAVSHQVKQLSDFLGIKLFARQGNSIDLTEEGRKIFLATQTCFDELSIAMQEVNQGLTPKRMDLKVRLTQGFSIYWLAPRLRGFISANPDIEVSLVHQGSPLNNDLEGFDVVIGHGKGQWRGFYADMILSDKLVPMCSRDLVEGDGVADPSMLANYPLIFETVHDWWSDWFALAGMSSFVPERRIITDGLFTFAIEAAVRGNGFILDSPSFLKRELSEGMLVAPFADELAIAINYYIVTPVRKSNPAASRFRDWIISQRDV